MRRVDEFMIIEEKTNENEGILSAHQLYELVEITRKNWWFPRATPALVHIGWICQLLQGT